MEFIPKTYTVESVTSGHPDKVCDQISDAILDECLKQDPNTRAGIETFGNHGLLVIGGEVTTNAVFDAEEIARKVYSDIGYTKDLEIICRIAQQSPDIAQGVDTGGAGDQGIMYGFATDETEEFLPKVLVQVHALAKGLEDLRRQGTCWIKPDGKTQITVENGIVKTVLVSTQHCEEVGNGKIKDALAEKLIKPIMGDTANFEFLVNPTGKFVQGGFEADAGLTGRKIMVDTYGGLITHGGGCFSGKDPSKVDRSAAYMCRFVAKNLVANGYAKQCLVSVAYAIGKAEPLMVEAINENGESIAEIAKSKFDFRPRAIIEKLNLRKPIYSQTSAYGHFGKSSLPWEEIVDIK
ncbi:MAG: methionine adenosyltransferase [Candidatus Staskawiczbacteria bacterium]|nr:methionine adenosyltransferase [Candidatus Staskawiczbacteria bacterium]